MMNNGREVTIETKVAEIEDLAQERDEFKNLFEQKFGEVLYLKAELYDKLCHIQALHNQIHDLQHESGIPH